ncbi:MAG: hypothetical protein KME06_04950 [Kastovskya adunca ATA6-11-RM4]|jgi:hypothetical protein|nr:hypothetical protein [Kastovskya adunca ATA6-11-RM4]
MKPEFKNMTAWNQAELLMQPAFLRVIDNIRKQLETSDWKGTYQDIQSPIPGYQLCLQRQNATVNVDIWELCYQVCFRNYQLNSTETESQTVEIDTSLLDETGDVDWQCLEAKTRQLVQQVFANLPL